MRKRDLFNKIGDIKGIFHARKGTIKVRSGENLTEAEEINKRQQEYTELYMKSCNDLDNCDGLVARHPGVWSQKGLRKHFD